MSSNNGDMSSNNDPSTLKPRKRGRSRSRRRSINSAERLHGFWENSDDDDDTNGNATIEPFGLTFLKVGVTLFLCSAVSYTIFLQSFYLQQPHTSTSSSSSMGDVSFRGQRVIVRSHLLPTSRDGRDELLPLPKKRGALRRPAGKPTSLTDFDVNLATPLDAYGVASKYHLDRLLLSNRTSSVDDGQSTRGVAEFAESAAQRRSQFARLVGGGEGQARTTLQRSLFTVLGKESTEKGGTSSHGVDGLASLAHRLGAIQKDDNPVFSVAVLGTSAAAGSGNYFEQSYAFVIQKRMAPLFQALGIQLQVRNLAVEDTTEFYATLSLWCASTDIHNLDPVPDLLIWDYGLSSRPEGFEAFLRTFAALQDGSDRFPFLVIRDTKEPNKNAYRNMLLQTYVDDNVLVDPLLVHVDQAAAPFLNQPDQSAVPEGFQAWTTSFGGPPGAPGKEHAHLTVKQHEMIGWLISMHLLSALELSVVADQDRSNGIVLPPQKPGTTRKDGALLPPPVVIKRTTRERWTLDKDEELIDMSPPAWLPLIIGGPEDKLKQFRRGDESRDADQSYYKVPNGLQCRSSYITPYAGDTLDELIVSGPVEGLSDFSQNRADLVEGLLLPKGKQFLAHGWVQDLDKATKRRKQLSKQWNFLGFQDMIKKAYYGLPSSGDLTLFIPLSKSKSSQARAALRGTGIMPARDYIETVVICETDVPTNNVSSDADRDEVGACRLHKDAYVYVGEEITFLETIPSEVSSSCVFLNVPDSANLSFKQDLINKVARENPDKGSVRLANGGKESSKDDRTIGLPIQIRVRSDRGAMKVPCSVAHVLWMEVREEDYRR